MTAARGRVIKADRVTAQRASVPWEQRKALDEEPSAQIDVVREKGVVVAITVRCICGRAHELELVPPAGGEGGGE